MLMKKTKFILWGLALMFAIMMSIPYLLPNCGLIALFAFVPLLCMEYIARQENIRHFWMYHYAAFVMWNAFTTFWVCNATVGGGIFAVLANAFQMSLIFGLFHLSFKRLKKMLPYVFLAAMWIAWERFYFDAEISWPWLVLGNSFARSTWAVQWYEYTGTLGGSLWIWASNLGLFGLMLSIGDNSFFLWNSKAKFAAVTGYALVLLLPLPASALILKEYKEQEQALSKSDSLQVAIVQPNIDPYHKFDALSQEQQDSIFLTNAKPLMDSFKAEGNSAPVLLIAPETFTNMIEMHSVLQNNSVRRYIDFLQDYPWATMLFGASTYDVVASAHAPTYTARPFGKGYWYETHNTAFTLNAQGKEEHFHKNKLVVAVEKTPYPAFFGKIDDLIGGVMGRNTGQGEVSLLHVGELPLGCAICYESIYGEYYTSYIRKGARAMAIITNDAWWGDTPGYRQHLSYASLRAIETRRAIARCANTGISAIITPCGQIKDATRYNELTSFKSSIPLRDDITFFVEYGDICGRICTFIFSLLLLALAVEALKR